MAKAYLNALMEEGTKADCFHWVCKLDEENDKLRDALRQCAATFDSGPATLLQAHMAASAELKRRMEIAGEALT